MTLTINGESREFSSVCTLSDLVAQLGMKPDRVAVELNRELVRRDRWSTTQLADGDKLEIVHFVGGGSALRRHHESEPANR
jgi:thiamine biosynthesis protein ThiS